VARSVGFKIRYDKSSVRKELASMISKLIQFKSVNPPVENFDVQLFVKEELEKVGLRAKLHRPSGKAVALTSSFEFKINE